MAGYATKRLVFTAIYIIAGPTFHTFHFTTSALAASTVSASEQTGKEAAAEQQAEVTKLERLLSEIDSLKQRLARAGVDIGESLRLLAMREEELVPGGESLQAGLAKLADAVGSGGRNLDQGKSDYQFLIEEKKLPMKEITQELTQAGQQLQAMADLLTLTPEQIEERLIAENDPMADFLLMAKNGEIDSLGGDDLQRFYTTARTNRLGTLRPDAEQSLLALKNKLISLNQQLSQWRFDWQRQLALARYRLTVIQQAIPEVNNKDGKEAR